MIKIYDCVQFENSLRRHNHIGLIHGLLKALAKVGKLNDAKDGARKALNERRTKKGNSMDED
jgi:ubiquitin carboxyl-terminal hydrolase L5